MSNSTQMYFLSLELENIRCFGEKQTLDLTNEDNRPAPWTLLLGDNGLGKTTLLQCLIWMRTTEELEPKEKSNGNGVVVKSIFDDEDNSKIESLIRVGDIVESSVKGSYSLGCTLSSISQSDNGNPNTIDVGVEFQSENGNLKDVNNITSTPLQNFVTPTLIAYSASRYMATLNFHKSELLDPVYNFNSDSAELYDAEEVLADLEYRALKFQDSNVHPLIDKVKQLLTDLLPELDNPCDIEILGPKGPINDQEPGGIRIKLPDGSIPLSALSLGYKTMLAWSIDLALRLLRSNPDSSAPLKEPAIVLVDEIDLHLHPKWQRQVKQYLRFHFPNVQFICTAHSPFMAQASEDENVVVLMREGDHVRIENDPHFVKGWRIDQLATSLMGVPNARSPEVEGLINERRQLLDKENLSTDDEKRLDELDDFLSFLPTSESQSDEEAMKLIREAAEILKSETQ